MKKITRSELLALFPKVQRYIEQRLAQDCVDGIIVFERTEEDPGQGSRTACVFGAGHSLKRWQDAEGKLLGDTSSTQKEAVAYYEKQHDSDEIPI